MEHIENPTIQRELGKTSSSHASNRKSRWSIFAIASIPLIMTLGNSMLIPVLPILERELNISGFQSSLVITVYSIVAILLIPIAGYLSDRYGRKIIIIPSLFISGAGGLIAGWASWKVEDPYYVILLGRMLQGIGAAGAFPIVLPLVGDLFKDEKEVSSSLGIIETSNTLGKVLSPILGAFLAGFIWFLPFLSFPILCIISAVLLLVFVKKPKGNETEPQTISAFLQKTKAIFKEHGRWLYAVFFIGIVAMFVLFGVLFYLSSILETKYDMNGIKKGFQLAIPLGALCIASYITGKKINGQKNMMKWVTVISFIIAGISVTIVSLSDQLIFLTIAFLICGVGIGASLPCMDAMITSSIEKKQRGTITSIYSSMRFLGVALGPPIVSVMMKKAELFMFLMLGFLCFIAAFIAFKAIRAEAK